MSRRRELIQPYFGDTRYVRRDDWARSTDDQVGVGRSLAADNNQRGRRDNPGGQGNKGDRRSPGGRMR